MLRCTLEVARATTLPLLFLILRGRMAEIGSKAGPSATTRITILCTAVCHRPRSRDWSATRFCCQCDGHNPTVARRPEGEDKSGYPHEPPRLRVPLDHRFG